MMYWKVRKYRPQELLQRYGAQAALAVSLLFNLFLAATRPNLNKLVSADVRTDFDSFARRVTNHILDTSYINYAGATSALMDKDNGELAPPVVQMLRRNGLLPSSNEDFQASLKTYTDSKRVCAINIRSVVQGDKDSQGLIPIDVYGAILVHSADESYPGPVPFHFHYRVGFRPNTTQPIVGEFADLSR